MSVCGSCQVNAFVPATHGRKLHARIRALEVRVNERDVQMSRLLLRLSEAEAGLAAFVDYFDTWDVSPPQITRLLNELREAGRESGRPRG